MERKKFKVELQMCKMLHKFVQHQIKAYQLCVQRLIETFQETVASYIDTRPILDRFIIHKKQIKLTNREGVVLLRNGIDTLDLTLQLHAAKCHTLELRFRATIIYQTYAHQIRPTLDVRIIEQEIGKLINSLLILYYYLIKTYFISYS